MVDDVTVKTVWMIAESNLLTIALYMLFRIVKAVEKLAKK